jgi:hypothetical protein
MSLRIRRGTDAQRTSKTFDLGEIVWTTDTQKLYVGDGLTAGGINALAAMAGTGFTFNATTQRIDFSLPNLNLNTSEVAEDSSRLYFTTTRAQASVAAALTAGNPYNSGIAFTYDNVNNRITAVATGTQVPSTTGNVGKYLTVGDDGSVQWHNPPIPGGLSVPSFTGNQGKYLTTDGSILTWANIAINTLSYTTVGNVTYNANLTDTGFTMPVTIKLAPGVDIKRDNGSGIFTTVLGGLSSVSADTSPTLGGNLSLGGHNISGTGNINTTGTITATGDITTTAGNLSVNGTITAISGLGGNLSLQGHNIFGTGNINPAGNIHAVGGNITADGIVTGNTIVATTGLGANLPLNSYGITGNGTVNITGNITTNQQLQGYTIVATSTISASQGLGADLSLNNHNLIGSLGLVINGTNGSISTNSIITGGGFNTTGTITASSTISGGSLTTSGTITATQGLGANLSLNSHNITGSGNLNITGNVNLNLNSSLNIRELLDGVHNYGYIITAMSRGTFASPTAVQAGDELGGIIFQAYTDSSTQATAGQISFIVDSNSTVTPGSGYVKSFVVISAATDTDQSANNAVTIDSAGVITSNAISVGDGSTAHPSIVFTTDGSKDSGFFHPGDGIIGVTINGVEAGRWNPTGLQVAGAIKTGSFNGSGSYPTPSAGMIIFDSSNNHFYGYDGSTWKQLDN